MNFFSKSAITILCFYILLGGSSIAQLVEANPESVGLSKERLSNLTNIFQQYVDNGKLSGSVILIARKGKIAYYESFGMRDIEQKDKMGKDAIFRIASQTKAITSVGIMMLQEQGKLLINDPVGKYIPEFQKTTVAVDDGQGGYTVEKANRPITIRDLLNHSSGIGYGFDHEIGGDQWRTAGIQGWYFANRKEPILETVKEMADLPFQAQPGEAFVYGYSTDILGAVIEIVSGKSLDLFLQENILDPLGMYDTHFYLPKDKFNRLATVYSSTENGLQKAPSPGEMVGQGAYVTGPRKSFSGGAGLLSTALDYSKFLQMLINGGEFNGNRIISRKSIELMTVNHWPASVSRENGEGFGLGFIILEDLGKRGTPGTVGEYGWGGAYHSKYWVDPEEDLTIVYLTQLIPANLDDHEKLRALVYQAIIN